MTNIDIIATALVVAVAVMIWLYAHIRYWTNRALRAETKIEAIERREKAKRDEESFQSAMRKYREEAAHRAEMDERRARIEDNLARTDELFARMKTTRRAEVNERHALIAANLARTDELLARMEAVHRAVVDERRARIAANLARNDELLARLEAILGISETVKK